MNSSRLKLAVFTDGIFPYVIGGMQKHSYYLVKYLAAKGCKIDLYHTSSQSTLYDINSLELFTESERANINNIIIDFPKSIPIPGHYIRDSYKYSENIFNEFMKKRDVDFVYAKGFSGWKYIQQKTAGIKLPPIGVKFHGYEMFQKQPGFKSYLQSQLFKNPVKYNTLNADFVFSYGGKITHLIKQIRKDENGVIEIPSAIENAWIREQVNDINTPLRFLFIGRFERRKGIEELSLSLNNLLKSNSDFHFSFVGPIPVEKRINNSKIKYYGSITDSEKIKTIIDSCDVLVCPSYSEGMPNVILEAMARGLAIIATDVGAVNCLVDSSNGWLLNTCSVNGIYKAITEAINATPENIIKMKSNSLEKIKKDFLWENISEKLIREIECIIPM